MAAAITPEPTVTTVAEALQRTTVSSTPADYLWGVTRISLGWVFLWDFLDRLLGLGYATERANAWVNGGSPTFGFLTHATNGPLAPAFQSLAGAAWADWLFMIGLAGIGVALMAGVAMRIAAGAGALLLLLIYAANPILTQNPFMDNHIIYALVLVGLALIGAGRHLGLGRAWERIDVVRRYPILR